MSTQLDTRDSLFWSSLDIRKHADACHCAQLWKHETTLLRWYCQNPVEEKSMKASAIFGLFFFAIPIPCGILSLRWCYCRWCPLQLVFPRCLLWHSDRLCKAHGGVPKPTTTILDLDFIAQPEGVAEATEETAGCEPCRFRAVLVYSVMVTNDKCTFSLHNFCDRTKSKQFLQGLKTRLCKLEVLTNLDNFWVLDAFASKAKRSLSACARTRWQRHSSQFASCIYIIYVLDMFGCLAVFVMVNQQLQVLIW